MKKLVMALAAVAAFSAPAFAADLAARPVKAPYAPVVAVTNWTGFYVYGGGGYGMWNADTTTINSVTNTCVLCVNQAQGGKGWLGQVGAGYDFQFGSSFVAGVFGDYNFSDISGTIQDQGPFSVATTKNDWSWAAGGRIGWLAFPSVLTYVGAGYTEAHFTGNNSVTSFVGAPTGQNYRGFSTGGWFLSSGVEAAVSFLPGLFWRNEYRYSRLDTKDFLSCNNTTGLCGSANSFNSIRFSPDVQTATTSLVYKFNWGGAPISAKY